MQTEKKQNNENRKYIEHNESKKKVSNLSKKENSENWLIPNTNIDNNNIANNNIDNNLNAYLDRISKTVASNE